MTNLGLNKLMTKPLNTNAEQTEPALKTYSRKRRVTSVLMWLIAWPLLIGSVGLVVLIAGANFLGNGSLNSPQGYQLRGLWLAYVGGLIILCLVIIRYKNRKQNPLATTSANILRAYMVIGIIISAIITAYISDPPVLSTDAGINVRQTNSLLKPTQVTDPTITATLAKVGAIDIDWIETKFVTSFDDAITSEQTGAYQAFIDTSGNWSYGVLTIKQGESGAALDTIVAHEYLHHVWFKTLDEATKTKLTSDLITIFGKDQVMQERVESYSKKQTLQPTELFSYYCAEVSDSLLTPLIVGECNKYINRGALELFR